MLLFAYCFGWSGMDQIRTRLFAYLLRCVCGVELGNLALLLSLSRVTTMHRIQDDKKNRVQEFRSENYSLLLFLNHSECINQLYVCTWSRVFIGMSQGRLFIIFLVNFALLWGRGL
jgi:hypothetical protein